MASITSISNSNYINSLYSNTNTISGLASGMDTESMIKSLTQGYQTKITQLQQKSTKVEWKQEAYRSIISKMYAFSNKYTSYTSSTNLRSPSFFESARTSTAGGEFASKVSASGTSTSDVVLNSVEQLATSARLATNGNFLAGDGQTIVASEGVNLTGKDAYTEVNALQGSLTLSYGSKTVSVVFGEGDKIQAQKKADGSWETQNEALARVINEKLADETIALSSGSTLKASDRVQAVAEGGKITFKPVDVNAKGEDKAGNSIYIAGGAGAFKDAVPDSSSSSSSEKVNSFQVPSEYSNTIPDNQNGDAFFRKSVPNIEKISGKRMNITLDGTTKSIQGPMITAEGNGYWVGGTVDKDGNRTGGTHVADGTDAKALNAAYVSELNKAVQKEFGTKVKISDVNAGDAKDTSMKLKFEVPENSDILINTNAGDALKIGKVASNYLSTSKTLADLLGEDKLNSLTPVYETDKNGDRVKNADGTDKVKTDAKGNTMYEFKLNGVTVGNYTKDTSLSTIMDDINSSEAGVKINYSRTSREFVLTTKDTGAHTKIELGDGSGNDLASAMFGSNTAVNKTQYAKDIIGDDNMQGKKFSVEMENGQKFEFTFRGPNATLQNIEDRINNEILKDSNMQASFSGANGALVLRNTATGETFGVKSYGDGDETAQNLMSGLGEANGYTAGRDAKFTVTVNGTTKVMTRSSNKAEIDGMTINFKGTFNEGYADAYTENKSKGSAALKEALKDFGDSVTFQQDIQADQVVDAVKNMIAEYNVIVSEVRSQYATMPLTSSSGSIQEYEPLTDEDREGMTETAIENYEAKAKQGLLFADSNLSNLYQGLVGIFNRTGTDRTMLENMGIGLSYDTNGAATVTFDENKFRSALENDFDGVVDMFTRTSGENGGTDGIMASMKTQMDRYGATTGAVKGILVQQAGTPLSSLSLLDNGWQTEIDNYSSQIEKWAEKLESQIDRYTQQFARMESLINQMNSQSSTLASLMGG